LASEDARLACLHCVTMKEVDSASKMPNELCDWVADYISPKLRKRSPPGQSLPDEQSVKDELGLSTELSCGVHDTERPAKRQRV